MAIGDIQVPVTLMIIAPMGVVGKSGLNLKNLVNPFDSYLKVTSEQDIGDCREGACLRQSVNASSVALTWK